MKIKICLLILLFYCATLFGCNQNISNNTKFNNETFKSDIRTANQTPQETLKIVETKNPSYKVYSINTEDSIIIRKLDLSVDILSSETYKCYNQTNIILYDNEVYYLNNNTLYKVDGNNHIISIKINELGNIIDNSKSRYGLLYGICMIGGQKYLIYIADDYESMPDYYLVNYENNVVIENYVGRPVGYFGNKIFVEIFNDEYEYTYGLFDVKQNKFTEMNEMRKYTDYYYLSEVSYATENCFIVELKNRTNYTGFFDDSKYIIFDANTYEEKGSIDFEEIDVVDASLFLFKNNAFYIFDEGHSCIKTYNIITGEIKTIIQFSEKCKFIKYETEENSIYLQAYNYNHKEDEYLNWGYHQNIESCIDENELETALQLYITYNLESNEMKIVNSIPTKEYIKDIDGETCVKLVKDYKIGNYIFTYYIDLTSERNDYKIFSSKFKIGEDIDFSLWRR